MACQPGSSYLTQEGAQTRVVPDLALGALALEASSSTLLQGGHISASTLSVPPTENDLGLMWGLGGTDPDAL